jgi:hypothetical protein
MLILLTAGNEKHEGVVASYGVTSVLNLAKNGQLVQKLKMGTNT